MDFISYWQSVILGIVEGLTEFLPVSSTGHLILASEAMGIPANELTEAFLVVIQAGAILAVCWYYRARIFNVLRGLFRPGKEQRLAVNTIVAFLPAVVLGLLLASFLKAHLFNSITVSIALIVGGVIILWAERYSETHPSHVRVASMDDLTVKDAFYVGLCQCLAMIPGTSRSGATIIGGMLLGLSRKAATEFSFFLAIPTIFGASFYDLLKHRELFMQANWSVMGVGLLISFFSALAVVHWLIGYVGKHSFKPFGWYRIVFGLIILVLFACGVVAF